MVGKRVFDKQALGQILNDQGITPSYHRLLILHELRQRKDHPSAEQIYQSLCPTIPTLSRTTVYNTLGLFTRKGLIRCLTVEGHEMRYDPDDRGEVHLHCVHCNAIIDPSHPIVLPLPSDALNNFEILQVQTIIKGVCQSCQKRSAQTVSA